jgi:SAM-dependent methyltransferase
MERTNFDGNGLTGNYSFDPDLGIWRRAGFSGIDYSDGDEIEARILGTLRDAQDVSIMSPELKAKCQDWATTYHFSRVRSNILRPFSDQLSGADVLEIGAGCGAITRYLGEIGARTLALEGSVRRASITRERTRELENVEIVSDDFMAFETDRRFDFITLIGVLEYANLFSAAADPALDLIKKTRNLLKPDGQLIVAIENQLGLKYFVGSPEDHLGISYYGIEGHYRSNQVETFGRQVLYRKLLDAGFVEPRLLLPLPDYKFPTTILKESALVDEGFDAAAFAWLNAANDPQNPTHPAFAQELVWPELMKNGLGSALSNSFLWVASRSNMSPSVEEPLAWHFSVNRKPEFCKATLFRRISTTGISVDIEMLDGKNGLIDSAHIAFNPAPVSEYINAPTLDREFGRIVGAPVLDLPLVVAYFKRYIDFLQQIALRENILVGTHALSTEMQPHLPGVFLDAVPRNLLITKDGIPVYFDREWISKSPLPIEYMIFRSLLTLFDTVSVVGTPSDELVRTFGDLLVNILRALKLPNDPKHLEALIEVESQLCEYVFGESRKVAIKERLIDPLPIRKSYGDLKNENGEVKRQLEALRASQIQDHKALIEFERVSRRPWYPIKRALQVSILSFLSRLSPPLPARTTQRFKRSANKRNLRLLVSGKHIEEIGKTKKKSGGGDSDERKMIYPTPVFIAPSTQNLFDQNLRVGLHLHISGLDGASRIVAAFTFTDANIFLLITVSPHVSEDDLNDVLSIARDSSKIQVYRCDEDMSPLVALRNKLRSRICEFDIFGSMTTAEDDATSFSRAQINYNSRLLLLEGNDGLSGAKTAFSLIATEKASLVIPRFQRWNPGRDRQAANAGRTAREVLHRLNRDCSFEVGPADSKPFMFWAKADLLADLFALEFSTDNPENSNNKIEESNKDIGDDVSAALLLHLSFSFGGGAVELCREDPTQFTADYEEKVSFIGKIKSDSPKVLCYYLPQFHPTPENDEWHGQGFTEWTKVRESQPLFLGHQQQRIPHPDIGYYQLADTGILKKQAEIMHDAGVHGMVFYHYWFSGRLILEKPVMRLLEDPSVDMPYCFCWANENWTRRWDGSEQEVLLRQVYSKEDAVEFIRHLFPYLRDPRYIKYKGRPLIFVYRPALIPEDIPYVDIWKHECREAGISEPLVIGTLKDGASEVKSHGMEAGVERVLHDWTDGSVTPIDSQLIAFATPPVNVLDYSEVSDFYKRQKPLADVPVIRSILPCFDNTPRYASRANITHNTSVPIFENWLGSLVESARCDTSIAGEFIVVNAWNEWAETAMVEPDILNGYGYLNAIGRVLSGASTETFPVRFASAGQYKVQLSFSKEMLEMASRANLENSDLVSRFIRGVLNSCEDERVKFFCKDREFEAINSSELDPSLETKTIFCRVQKLFIPNKGFFERLVDAASSTPNEQFIAYGYGDHNELLIEEKGYWGRVPRDALGNAPVIVGLRSIDFNSNRIRIVPSTFATLLLEDTEPVQFNVSTVVRIHHSGSMQKLERALQCLCAQRDACVSPVVLGQDLSPTQIAKVKELIEALPWRVQASPSFENYASWKETPDLRSRLLKLGIESSRSRYQAFLDYDDLLLSDAYLQLVLSMRRRGKGIGFGRTYRSFTKGDHLWLTSRDRYYETEGNYMSFLANNFAPLHSYLIDSHVVDLSQVKLPDDQKFMEDYLMLLQIVDQDNADWDGLNENTYIGDYLHYDNGSSTVSVMDDARRKDIAKSPIYKRCNARVTAKQAELISKIEQR